MELDWEIPAYREFFQHLGHYFKVVRYDRPGSGLSGQDRKGFTLKDEVETLSELIKHLAVPSCTLLGVSCGGPPCISYAHNNPNSVKQIIFLDSYVDGGELGSTDIQDALCSLVSAHWGLGTKALLDLFDPNMDALLRKQLSKIHKNSTSSDMAEALLKLSFKMDARREASQLSVPTLIIHHLKDRTVPFDAGRNLASILPDAQLVSIEGSAHLPWMGNNSEKIIQEITHFTNVTAAPTPLKTEHNQFRKTGEVWAISFSDRTIHIKDSRGLQDIAMLVRNKHKEFHVSEIASVDQSSIQESQAEVLDQQAINSYKLRLQEIIEEKQSAADGDDENRYASLEQEEDAIVHILKQGLGLGNKQRYFDNSAEKARKAVTARIKVAINKIQDANPLLAEHFHSSLKTGNFCSYSPSPEINWLT